MNINKLVFIYIICQSLAGCGLAQRMELDRQYKEQQKETALSTPGMKAIEYLIKDDKMVAIEGGKSLCPSGCSIKDVIDKANATPLGITAFYVAVHNYSWQSPSLNDIGDPEIRSTTVAEILNRYTLIFGTEYLSDSSHVSDLYRDFSMNHEYLGLKNVSELDFKKSVGELYRKRSDLVVMINSMRDEAINNARQIQNKKAQDYDKAYPEVPVAGIGNLVYSEKSPAFRKALNSMPFVTRAPGTNDLSQIYAKVGRYHLTLSQVMISIKEQLMECRRISAYSGYDLENLCSNQISNGISAFVKAIKDKNTPDMTKKAALGEAKFGGYIDFEHAARLMVMHNKLCEQQGNMGYVTMVTVDAPCRDYKGAGIN